MEISFPGLLSRKREGFSALFVGHPIALRSPLEPVLVNKLGAFYFSAELSQMGAEGGQFELLKLLDKRPEFACVQSNAAPNLVRGIPVILSALIQEQ